MLVFSRVIRHVLHCDAASIFRNCQQNFSISIRNIPQIMECWQAHAYGNYDQLDLSRSSRVPPVRNPTDVLVKVHAASVNPIDVALLGGYGTELLGCLQTLQDWSTVKFPLKIFGRDFAGEVVDTGCAVTSLSPGDEVWGAVPPFGDGSLSSHSQYLLTSSTNMSHKPKSLNMVEASSIPYVALTTWSALFVTAGLDSVSVSGKKILILGGSGGIGMFAVQLLKALGGQVVTTCHRDSVDKVESLGADVVIDYQDIDVEFRLKEHAGYDVILNASGVEPSPNVIALLRPWTNAKYVTLTSPFLRNFDRHGLVVGMACNVADLLTANISLAREGTSHRWAFFMPNQTALQKVSRYVDNGLITPVIDSVFDFKDLPEAYQKQSEGGPLGKVVVQMAK